MAEDPKKDVDQKEVGAQFIGPETSIMIFGFLWYVVVTMFQSVCGWLGIQLFKRMWDRIRCLWKKDGDDEETSSEISEEESAAASSRTLSG